MASPPFRVLGDPFQRRAFRATIVTKVDPYRFLRGLEVTEYAIEFKRAEGREFRDFVWTTRAVFFFVSRRLVDLLIAHDATGWESHRVVAREWPDRDYFALSITGRCGPPNPDLQTIALKQYPGGPFPVVMGLGIDPATWDGSDIFMADDKTGWVFLSERMVKILIEARVSNIEFTDPDTIALS